MAFTIETEMKDSVAILTLEGELDAAAASDFRTKVEEVAQKDPKSVVLMMDDLTFMASAGLRVLVFTKQKMGTGVDLYVVGAHDAVLETITMTGFHHSVIMLDEYDAAEIEGA